MPKIKVYVLKHWKINTITKEGYWENEEVTFDKNKAYEWLEPCTRTWASEGTDPNRDYDEFEVDLPEEMIKC